VDGTVISTASRLVGIRCRTSDRTAVAEEAVPALASVLAGRLGTKARMIGSPGEPRDGGWEEDLADARGCLLEAGGQVDDALAAGVRPVVLAGDCSICLATLPTVVRHRPEARILWLDAHGDYNSPETTTSDFLGGMCLAAACGEWDSGHPGTVPPEQVVLAGVRDLDPGERGLLAATRARVLGPGLRMPSQVPLALDDAPVYIHLDLDVLDPTYMPAQFPVPGGVTWEVLGATLRAAADHREVLGIEITAFHAEGDAADRAALARRVADVVVPILTA
jgi:arginase family enzyme